MSGFAAAPDQRLFSEVSDSGLTALGIDETTLRRASVLTSKEQLQVFAPYCRRDHQREVLEYLAEGFTVEKAWRDLVFRRAARHSRQAVHGLAGRSPACTAAAAALLAGGRQPRSASA